jgi:adenylylsulfate kinase-like enzyme
VITRQAEGILLTGVFGAGKSSVAAEIAYLLEQRVNPTPYWTWTT